MRPLPALAKTVFAGFIASLLVGLIAAVGTRLGFWDYRFGIGVLMPWCVGIGGIAALLGIVWILWAMIANDSSAARYGLIGLVGAIAVLYNPISDFAASYGMPPIHDVSTDTEHPPPFVALLSERDGATNSPVYDGNKKVLFDGKLSTVEALQHKYEAGVRSQMVLIAPEIFFKRVLAAAYGMGWDVVAIAPDEGRIEATDTTFFFGLTDDIVLRIKPAGMGARVDVRSEARNGESDDGRDAQRVIAFLKHLSKTN